MDVLKHRGRTVTDADVVFIRQLIAAHPRASRRALSKKLCEAWNWVQPNGVPRDMVCRGLMLALHRAGHIELPPVRWVNPNPLAQGRRRPSRTLGRLWRFDVAKLTSEFFWDQMDRLPVDALPAIQTELARRVRTIFGLQTDSLFYDVTNFFTFIDSTNQHCDLPQRGKNKQKRGDLRQFQMGLLVSRDGWIPLLSILFRGNHNDVTTFPGHPSTPATARLPHVASGLRPGRTGNRAGPADSQEC